MRDGRRARDGHPPVEHETATHEAAEGGTPAGDGDLAVTAIPAMSDLDLEHEVDDLISPGQPGERSGQLR